MGETRAAFSRIVVAMGGAADDAPALAAAAALAKESGAAVVAILAFADPTQDLVWAGEGFITALPQTALDAIRKSEAEIETRVRDLAASATVEADLDAPIVVDRVTLDPETALLREAPLTDLFVFGPHAARGEGPLAGAFEAAVMRGRSGVLVARNGAQGLGDVVAIAWDGGLEAGRAVRAGLPVLQRAGRVVILQASQGARREERPAADPARVVDWLAGHGVVAEVSQPLQGKAETAIMAGAMAIKAGLLVSGAYGHARAQEFLFGGATRAFLEASQGPSLLLAH